MDSSVVNGSGLVAASLVLWAGLVFALARAAERRATGSTRAPSVATVALVLVIAGLAGALRATPAAAFACGVTCVSLVVAAEADARIGLLFDAVTLPTAILTSFVCLAAGDATAAVWGVALLVGPFWSLVFVTHGRAIGMGDVKAMFAIGAAFGPLESWIAIFGACVSGIVGVSLAGRLRSRESVRFGPHLAVGCALALAFGDPIVHFIARP